MDDIYYEPIKENNPGELLLEAIQRIARMEATREVERIIHHSKEQMKTQRDIE